MAIAKARGKKPAEKPAAASSGSAPASSSGNAVAKATISVKRRLANGDELFVAPGIEISCPEGELDAKQAEVENRVNDWLTKFLAKFPDPEEELEEEEAEADEEEAEEEEGEEEEGEEITEEDIASMKAAELKQLIKDEELEVDPKGMKLAELREAVADALFGEEEEEEPEEEEADEEEGEDEEGFTEEDLQEMKLGELQEIAEKWEIGAPKMPKGAKLAAKKSAYIKHILEAQEEVEEE